jgi:hypothetical protein
MSKISMVIPHLQSELTCSYGGNNGVKILLYTALDSLSYHTNLRPNIKILLQLFATLPVTSFTLERTFSALNRLKFFLRSTLSENRLNGLVMANINIKEQFDESEIITEFARNSSKKMQLSEWSK